MVLKNSPIVLIILLLFIVNGCIVYTADNNKFVDFDIVVPATIKIPSDFAYAAVQYNNCNYEANKFNLNFKFNDSIYYDASNYDSIASITYYEIVRNEMRKNAFFDTVVDLGISFPPLNDSLILLSEQQADSLLEANSIDLLFSLDYFVITDYSGIDKYEVKIRSAVVTESVWNIYFNSKDSRFHTIIKRDTLYYEKPGISKRAQLNAIKERPQILAMAARESAEKLVNSILPNWITVDRVMFLSGNLQIKEANKLADNNEWLKAAEIWKSLIESPNKNIAAKCMFNLALACEMNGDLEAAMEWVIKSYYVFEQKNSLHAEICKNYISILAQRKLDFILLNEQLGFENN